MDAARWPLVKDRFSEALALPDAERRHFLSTLDEQTRADVEALLDAADAGPLDLPLDAELLGLGVERLDRAPVPEPDEARRLKGARVGPYRIEERIGRGGMGDVYRARRDDGLFERAVALKVVRADTDAVLARFAAERRILGTLEHPGIARLIAAGSEDEGPTAGRPWLALELVEGEPLTEAVKGLGLEARLRLLVDVAEAVHHAHRRLVVHRDLKPSNVLVAEREDGTRAVKLLDFGIAKIVDPEADADLTRLHARRPMTRAYAAPEQIRGDLVTTATDVYGLGLLLYEVLTASRPFRTDQSIRELEAAILDAEPPLASAASRAEAGGIDPKRLRGDLDVICRKALAKEPDARYASAEAFAADLHRYLAGEPIEARAPSAWYRVRRFVSRHRAAVAAAALVLVSVGVGVTATLWQAQRAEAAAAESAATAAFLSDLFQSADPTVAAGDTLTALDLLDRGARRLDTELAAQPGVRANLYAVIADAYLGLGRPDSAEAFARRALTIRRLSGAAPDLGRAVDAQILLALSLKPTDPERSDRVFQEAVAQARRSGDDAVLLGALGAYGLFGSLAAGSVAENIAVLEEAIALCRRVEGEGSPRLGRLLYERSLRAVEAGDHSHVERLLRDALAYQPAATHPMERSVTLTKLSELLLYSGHPKNAQPLAEEALALRRHLFGSNDARTAEALAHLSIVEGRADRLPDAERHAREALSIAEHAGGARTTLDAYMALVEALNMQSRHDEAVEVARRMTAFNREAFGPGSALHITAVRKLALSLSLANRAAESLPLWDEVIRSHTADYGPTSSVVVSLLLMAGKTAREGGYLDRAEQYFTQANERSRTLPATSRVRAEAALRLGWLLLDRGRIREALEPLRAAAEARDVLAGPPLLLVYGATSDGDRAAALLGEALVATGDSINGLRHLADAAPALADSLGPDHPDAQRARDALDRARPGGS